MNRFFFFIFVASMSTRLSAQEFTWGEFPSVPDRQGLAGPYVGVSDGRLIVAGGANFPDSPPWLGGTKVWHDDIYALETLDGTWKRVGKLPTARAYGITISNSEGMTCIGGSDSSQHFAEVVRIRLDQDRVRLEQLPSLPEPVANACGASWNGKIFLIGGTKSPSSTEASTTVWSIDLTKPDSLWKRLEDLPSVGRMLSVCGVSGDGLFVFGGVSLHAGPDGKPVRTYLRDSYRYTSEGWERIADLPLPATAAPSPAIAIGTHQLMVLGGDEGLYPATLPQQEHPGFSKKMWIYDTKQDRWSLANSELPAGHVTTSTILWEDRFIVPTGEIRPGVRSPRNWWLRIR
jgi:N-acetylneuraminate epimerase